MDPSRKEEVTYRPEKVHRYIFLSYAVIHCLSILLYNFTGIIMKYFIRINYEIYFNRCQP